MTKRGGGSNESRRNVILHVQDEKNLVPPKNCRRKEKGQVEGDLAFKLKLSAGGSLFRIGTRRSRRRPRGHWFFFLRTSAQA